MARIDRASVDQVVAAADMLEVVGRYTALKKSGANYTGLCPFHEEKTPSFSVNPVEKLYYCFGCGAGGDVIKFVELKENLDFGAAVELLAERYGIELRYEERGPDEAARRRRDRLRALLEQACKYYERVLWEARAAQAARAYLQQRGLGEEICRQFRLGYSFSDWRRLHAAAIAKGYTERELLDAGLVVRGGRGSVYDRFRGRLMFPLIDERGRVLGFGARTLGNDLPKYLNSPETALYRKGQLLYGLEKAKEAARKEDRIFVVEGYTDVLALAQAGVHNVVASMGTALTEDQLKSAQRYTANVYLCFDADAAGLGAMNRALGLARGLDVTLRVVRVPDGLDPADYVQTGHTAADFRRLAEQAQSLLQFAARAVLSAHDLATPNGRARAVAQLGPVLARAEAFEREEVFWSVSEALGVTREIAQQLFRGITAAYQDGLAGQTTAQLRERLMAPGHDLEARFLAACLAVPEHGRHAVAAVDESYFADAGARRAYEAVRARLERQGAGKDGQETGSASRGLHNDVLAEVLLRAAGESFSERILQELLLRVQEAHVGRLIRKASSRLKAAGSADEIRQEEARLLELGEIRRRLLADIRHIRVPDARPSSSHSV